MTTLCWSSQGRAFAAMQTTFNIAMTSQPRHMRPEIKIFLIIKAVISRKQ
jgi:hypothetical protein